MVSKTVSDYYRVTLYNVFLDHNAHCLPNWLDLRDNMLLTIYAPTFLKHSSRNFLDGELDKH